MDAPTHESRPVQIKIKVASTQSCSLRHSQSLLDCVVGERKKAFFYMSTNWLSEMLTVVPSINHPTLFLASLLTSLTAFLGQAKQNAGDKFTEGAYRE